MKIYETLEPSPCDTAVALGSFDGLHIGHHAVIGQALTEPDLMPTVFTFAHNPLYDLGGKAGGALMTRAQKIARLESWGVRQLYLLPFSSVMSLSPRQFVENVLGGVCRAKKACCGTLHLARAAARPAMICGSSARKSASAPRCSRL